MHFLFFVSYSVLLALHVFSSHFAMSKWFFALPALLRLALAVPLNVTNTTVDHNLIPPSYIPPPSKRWWPGWPGVQNMIVFGDSYTTTTFNISKEQPSRENPFGNPAFPG